MAGNENLGAAKRNKKDEFYTTRSVIEDELRHYAEQFEGKRVYCNCDDPEQSEFWQFFKRMFKPWKLKSLTATHYEPNEQNYAYKLELSEDTNGDGVIDWNDEPVITQIECNGDFRNEICIELLKEADIVVTNPPFSLFRDYVAQLIEHDKKFLIIGNMNAITYKEIFPLLKENKIWMGYGFNKTCEFIMPDDYELKGKAYVDENGVKHGFVPAICWFTNLDVKKRHEFLDLRGNYYDLEKYPKYDNYDGIDIGRYDGKGKWKGDITIVPCDYAGVMGVPVTFMGCYNPEQFEIIGCADYTGRYGSDELGVRRIGEEWMNKYRLAGGRGHYTANMTSLVLYGSQGEALPTFKRILIRNRHPEPPRVVK